MVILLSLISFVLGYLCAEYWSRKEAKTSESSLSSQRITTDTFFGHPMTKTADGRARLVRRPSAQKLYDKKHPKEKGTKDAMEAMLDTIPELKDKKPIVH